jgi:hypothetical protein
MLVIQDDFFYFFIFLKQIKEIQDDFHIFLSGS